MHITRLWNKVCKCCRFSFSLPSFKFFCLSTFWKLSIFMQLNCLHQNDAFEGLKFDNFSDVCSLDRKSFIWAASVPGNVSYTLSIFMPLTQELWLILVKLWLTERCLNGQRKRSRKREKLLDKLTDQLIIFQHKVLDNIKMKLCESIAINEVWKVWFKL